MMHTLGGRRVAQRRALRRSTLLVLAAAPLTTLFAAGAAGAPPADPLPELDAVRLRGALAGLPDRDVTGAILRVSGQAGRWSGSAGVTRLRSQRRPHPDGRFRIGSVTKMFTATIALQLAAEGELELDRPVQRYLPDVLPRRYPRVLVSQLLNHTSGLPDSTEDAGAVDPRWYVAHRFDHHSPREVVATATTGPMIHAPGAAQRYNGLNYFLAGMVIEKVTGRSYAHELAARITGPLALHDTYLPTHNDPRLRGRHAHGYLRIRERLVDVTAQSPYPWAEGGMISSAPDLAHFLRALFRGGLLPDPQQHALFTIPRVPYADADNCSRGPTAGHACFSMGLTRTVLPNGVRVWGKSGSTHGYANAAFATRDLRRVLVYSLNPTGNRDGSEGSYVQRIIAAVLDPAM